MTPRARRPSRLLVAFVFVLGAVVTFTPSVVAFGFLESVIARAAIQTIGLDRQRHSDLRAVNARRDQRLAGIDAAEAALRVKAERGWLRPTQVEAEKLRLEALRQAYTETARRERQIVNFQTRRRIDAKFKQTLRDAIKITSGADPRAIDFIVDIFEGKNPLEAAVDAAMSQSAGVADPRQPFVALRDQLRDIERAVSSLGGAETLAVRARIRQALREAAGIADGDGPPPDDQLQRLQDISGQLGHAAARLQAIRDDLIAESPGIAAERFAHDQEWESYRGAIEALDSTEAKQRVTAAVWRRAVDRVVETAAAAGLQLSQEQLLALSRAVVDAWVDARLEHGLLAGEVVDIDELVRTAIDEARAAAGLEPLFVDPEPAPVPAATADPTPLAEPTTTPQPTQQVFASFSGQWETTYGDMVLGDGRGTYDSDDGRLMYDVEGLTLDGFWIETGSARTCDSAKDGSLHWGRIVVLFADTFDSFSGSWGYCDGDIDQGAWDGTR